MATTQQDSMKRVLWRQTSVELATTTSPSLIALSAATVVFNWPVTVLG
jgi:hypothetical protein